MKPKLSTKDRLLDAAEGLLADRGYLGTSLRSITSAAEVNLAAAHYHFGGKLELFRAVVERRVQAVNAERLERMDDLEARAEEPQLEEILEALLAPALQLSRERNPGMVSFLRFMGRTWSSTGEELEAIHQVFLPIRERFFPALARALPHLQPADLSWRMNFLISAMCTLIIDPDRVRLFSDGNCGSTDPETMLRQFVAYTAAGFRAPSVFVSEGAGASESTPTAGSPER